MSLSCVCSGYARRAGSGIAQVGHSSNSLVRVSVEFDDEFVRMIRADLGGALGGALGCDCGKQVAEPWAVHRPKLINVESCTSFESVVGPMKLGLG